MAKMRLDELLARQESAGNLATVEPVKDDPNKVKVTPWTPEGGCLCHLALTIPKDTIESVESTDKRHYCCNKVLQVVEIQFKKGGAIELNDLFQQVGNRASDESKVASRPFDSGSMPRPPFTMGHTSVIPATLASQHSMAPSVRTGPRFIRSSSVSVQMNNPNCYNPNCYNDCFDDCFWPCFHKCKVPSLACIAKCQGACQFSCNSRCRVTCSPCQIDAAGNSTRICCQGPAGSECCWTESCCIQVGQCERNPQCSTGYCQLCCTYIGDQVLCGLTPC